MTQTLPLSSTSLRLLGGTFLLIIGTTLGLYEYFTQTACDYHYLEAQKCEGDPFVADLDQEALTPPPNPLIDILDVHNGDTFSKVLRGAGLKNPEIYRISQSLGKAFNPKHLKPKHKIILHYKGADQKELERLVIQLSMDQDVVVDFDGTTVKKARLETKELKSIFKHARGTIDTSLYVDAIRRGTHPRIIHDMIQEFSYDIDFQRSFQKGDGFEVFFDTHINVETEEEKPGSIYFAKLHVQGKTYQIFRHRPQNGTLQFYNEKGEAIKKGLLMTPVDGARISSTFGKRKHPVLGYTKMHKGVDFAAPRGTPIMAAGAGKIIKIGRLGTYGNYIKIKHNDKYSTAYAHMCRFAKNLKVGSTVTQGQVIGYVGCTGRATGNHLHYELLAHGKQVNPKHVKMMPAGKLSGKELHTFLANKDKMIEKAKSFDMESNEPMSNADNATETKDIKVPETIAS